MKIVLFDWTSNGHHPHYLRRFSEVLSSKFDVVAAIPDEMIEAVKNLSVEIFPLGKTRPIINMNRPLAAQNRALAYEELELFEKVAKQIRPNHIVHLYADPIIRRLVERPLLTVPTTLCIFFPRAHYPFKYKTSLSPIETLRAWFLEYLIARWRQRSDAHSVFTLDEEASIRWAKMSGAPVFWLPEPFVGPIPATPPVEQRSGCIVYGALDIRKRIDLLAQAISLEPISIKVVLAGSVSPGFESKLLQYVREMEQAGAEVELRTYPHNELEGLIELSKARCAILPYTKHYTMSRVLLEACSVGTPVVTNDRGLLGHLVRQHGLGLAVDCTDPLTLREALITLSANGNIIDGYSDALANFALRYSKKVFIEAISKPFS